MTNPLSDEELLRLCNTNVPKLSLGEIIMLQCALRSRITAQAWQGSPLSIEEAQKLIENYADTTKPHISSRNDRGTLYRHAKIIAAILTAPRLTAQAPTATMDAGNAFQELLDLVTGTQAGDEPNCYADFDRLNEITARCRRALKDKPPIPLQGAEGGSIGMPSRDGSKEGAGK